MTLPRIDSPKNSRILALSKLLDKKARRQTGLFLIEGWRMVADAVQGEAPIEEVYLTPEAMARPGAGALMARLIAMNVPVFETAPAALRKISDTETPQGMVAVARRFETPLDGLRWKSAGLLLIADAVSDPGNLGSLARVGAAAGAHGLILTPGCCDWTSPKVLRASMGSVFVLPMVRAEYGELFDFLRRQRVVLYGTAGRTGRSVYEAPVDQSLALAFGNEGDGLTRTLQDHCDDWVHIPMSGAVDSLNVASAAAVIAFEVVRRRRFAGSGQP